MQCQKRKLTTQHAALKEFFEETGRGYDKGFGALGAWLQELGILFLLHREAY